MDGDISRDDYLLRKEQNEREIAHWQARTTETREIALELGMCLEAVEKIARLWDTADDEDRQGMAQNLFDEVVVNVDTRRIESFKLKPWADRFLVLRMELYRDKYPELAEEIEASLGEKENPLTGKGQGNHMPHRGLLDTSVFEQLAYAARRMIIETYAGILLSQQPISHITPTQCERNDVIRLRHQQGKTLINLAYCFGLSVNRVWQIVHGRRE